MVKINCGIWRTCYTATAPLLNDIMIRLQRYTGRRIKIMMCKCLDAREIRQMSEIPQCTSPICHNAPLGNRNVHVCIFLLQSGALWDICQIHCGICEMSLLQWVSMKHWNQAKYLRLVYLKIHSRLFSKTGHIWQLKWNTKHLWHNSRSVFSANSDNSLFFFCVRHVIRTTLVDLQVNSVFRDS